MFTFLSISSFFAFKYFARAEHDHLFDLILREKFAFMSKSTLLYNKRVPSQLDSLTLDDFFLDSAFRNQSIDHNLSCLANSVGSVHSL